MQTNRPQRSVQAIGTPSTMKRVGGGYVLQTVRVEQAINRLSAPKRNHVGSGSIARSGRTATANATQPRPRITQARQPTQPATARKTNQVGSGSIARSGRTATVNATQTRLRGDQASPPPHLAAPTRTITPATKTNRLGSELCQLKREKEALSAALADKSVQLRDALQREVRLNAQVGDLKEKLEVLLTKNVKYQLRLHEARVTHVEDEKKIKMATKGQEQLKADVARSRKMLEGFKTFMVEQGKQMEALQNQSHGVHELEDFYRKHWEQDQLKIKIAMKENEELKEEVTQSREMLLGFKAFMENKVNELDKVQKSIDIMKAAKAPYICVHEAEAKWNKVRLPDDLITSSQMHESTESASRLGSEAQDNHDLITSCPKQSPTRTSGSQSAGMDNVTHQDAARGNQVRSCYALITSLRRQVIELEMLLKEYEFKNQLLVMQLDQVLKESKK